MPEAVVYPKERLGRRLFTSGAIFLILLGVVDSFSLIVFALPTSFLVVALGLFFLSWLTMPSRLEP